MTAPLRCAVLDDFQGVATTLADWSPVTARGVEVVTYRDHLADEDELAARLAVTTSSSPCANASRSPRACWSGCPA